MHKLGCAEMMSAAAKLDAERAEFEAERRDFDRQQYQSRQLAELSRVVDAQKRADYYKVASLLLEVRDQTEWGEGTDGMRARVEAACRTFEQDREMRAEVAALVEQVRFWPESDQEDEDEDEWEEDDHHDASTDGAIDYDPAEYDESTMPATHDPNDPALDLNNTHISAEDLIPPAGDDDGED